MLYVDNDNKLFNIINYYNKINRREKKETNPNKIQVIFSFILVKHNTMRNKISSNYK